MAKDPKPVTFVSSTKAEVPSEPVRVTRITAEIEATRFSIVCWDGDKKVAERVARHFKNTEHGTTIEYSDASSVPDIEDVAFEVDLEDLLTFDLDTSTMGSKAQASRKRQGKPWSARSRKCPKLLKNVWSTGILLHIAENVLLCVS